MYSKILGFNIFNLSKSEFIEQLDKIQGKVSIISGNPEVLYNGYNNVMLKKHFLSEEALIIPDGVGTIVASKISRVKIQEKIAGIEVFEEILKKCEREGNGVYLLGASKDVIIRCKENIETRFPKLEIAGFHDGYIDVNNCKEILEEIKETKPYAIFIAMGSPLQESFIVNYMEELPTKVFMGVGGAFDVFAGKVDRAPKWMLKLGVEWLYRVIKEPFRIKRLFVIPKFLMLVLKRKN